MLSEIVEVGDWVVAGTTRDDRDVGKITALHGSLTATVQWTSGVTTDIDLSADDVEVYWQRAAAMERMEALDALDKGAT